MRMGRMIELQDEDRPGHPGRIVGLREDGMGEPVYWFWPVSVMEQGVLHEIPGDALVWDPEEPMWLTKDSMDLQGDDRYEDGRETHKWWFLRASKLATSAESLR